jgi:hypothetical protein
MNCFLALFQNSDYNDGAWLLQNYRAAVENNVVKGLYPLTIRTTLMLTSNSIVSLDYDFVSMQI